MRLGSMTVAKRYANIKELAEYTGLSPKTLYDWAANGVIPSLKVGKKVLFDIPEVDTALARMKRHSQPQSEAAEEMARSMLAGHRKTVAPSSENEAYNGVQQHDQRDLSEEKGERDV